MANLRLLFKVATIAGPAVVKIILKYAPLLRQMRTENPSALQKITDTITSLTNFRKNETSSENLFRRGEVLREQLTYLYAGAKTPEMAKKARQWRMELLKIEKSIPLLDAMSKKNQKLEMKILAARIDELSAEIIAANIAEEIEDAEIDESIKNDSSDTGVENESKNYSAEKGTDNFPQENIANTKY